VQEKSIRYVQSKAKQSKAKGKYAGLERQLVLIMKGWIKMNFLELAKN